jgi:hypothetical protein
MRALRITGPCDGRFLGIAGMLTILAQLCPLGGGAQPLGHFGGREMTKHGPLLGRHPGVDALAHPSPLVDERVAGEALITRCGPVHLTQSDLDDGQAL